MFLQLIKQATSFVSHITSCLRQNMHLRNCLQIPPFETTFLKNCNRKKKPHANKDFFNFHWFVLFTCVDQFWFLSMDFDMFYIHFVLISLAYIIFLWNLGRFLGTILKNQMSLSKKIIFQIAKYMICLTKFSPNPPLLWNNNPLQNLYWISYITRILAQFT